FDPACYAAVSVGAAPICRKDPPLSFEIDATLQGRAFYFGANGWGMTEKEAKVLDRLPGRQGFCLLRWANLIPRPEETVNFNGDPYSTAVSVGAAPICRKDVPLSFEIDATLQGRAFYFGANGWGMTEKETKVLDRLPGRQGFRLIRWANLIPRPEETPPTGALTSEKGMRDLSDFVARQYKGRECAVKEYSGMLKNRGIEVLAVPFGVAAGYTQFYPKEQLNATDDVYIMKSEHIADWAAYLAECVWFVTTQLDVPIRYLELVNEPDGSWDTYLTPTQYVALLTKTDLALRSRSVTQTEIAGPAVAGLVSGLTCQDMNGVFLEKCYLEELTTTAGASAMLGAVSVHPWDDVYNLEHRPVSFLDEQFARFTRKKEEVRLGEKKFIVSEWGGLNMVTMNLGGQRFNTTAAECYVQPTGSDNEKRESNIAVSPLWAVRAFANLLILINNGVEDALYWMLHDIEWSRGCLGLYDRAGEPSVAMEAFEPFFKLWPSKPARAVTRAWANGVDGKTEDVVVAALTDGCRVLVAAVNTKDAAETFTLKVNGMSDRARTQAVETYNNNNLVPEVVPGAALQVTLASYGMLVFAIDEPGCSGDTEWYTTPSAAHDANVVPMVMVWAALLAVGVAGGCYTSKKARDADKTPAGSDQSSQPNDTRNTTPAAPGDSEGTDAFVLRMPLNSEESDGVRKPVNHAAAASRSLALVVGLDVVFHVVALTQGFSAPARFSFYGADLRELGRLVEDAYVLHAARVFVLLLLWRLHSTAVIHAATWFSYYRPAALAVAFFLAAKVRVRLAHALDEVCWFDLDVQTRVKPVPDPWFWTAIAQGLLFAGVELALVWYLKRGEEAGDAPAASLRPAAAAAAPKKANLDALSSLRFFAALHIVVYHFHASGSRTWNVFASWGASHLTFFFMLSGFVLSYQYGDRTIRQTDFWIKRAIRLYPVYILSCLVGVLVMDSALFKWSDTVFVFLSVQKWTGPAINYINTPGWAVGPFLLMYAIFPTLRDIILTVSRQKRVTVLLPLVYITGMMAAGDALGENWTGVFAPLNHVFLSAHFPSFLYGVVSGLNYLERSKEGRFSLVTFSDVVATPAILTALLALFCLVDLSQEHGDQPFWHEWARFGMLQPVFGALIWYSSRGHDFASKILGADTVVFFGRYSFTIYLLQAPLFMAAQRYFGMPYPTEDWACGAFLYALIAASILVCEYFEAPVGKLLQHAWTTVLSPNLPNLLNLVPEVPLVLCVVGYYAMMAGIFLMFASLAVFGTSTVLQWEGDSYMFDLTDSGIFDTVVTVIKWMALASLPVAVVGLAGQILFPPVLKRKVPTLKQMLDDTLPGVPHFTHRLHFRIVTRGKAPLLVLENVETAARVLESCLPRNKYEIEVVTDNDMQLQTRTATPVTEIVVPTAYATPTGAKFKARALEYAIHNSSCTREDWIVHQGW
ncbi:Beta-1, partial [Diplonema papillatum]